VPFTLLELMSTGSSPVSVTHRASCSSRIAGWRVLSPLGGFGFTNMMPVFTDRLKPHSPDRYSAEMDEFWGEQGAGSRLFSRLARLLANGAGEFWLDRVWYQHEIPTDGPLTNSWGIA
jgi:hypothetical protein